jgi:hypothetical protein
MWDSPNNRRGVSGTVIWVPWVVGLNAREHEPVMVPAVGIEDAQMLWEQYVHAPGVLQA